MPAATQAKPEWRVLCQRQDLVANSGVVAWMEGEQVALFYLPDDDAVYAIGNKDPRSGANVIGRGIVGRIAGDLVVASPLYKQHFSLADGSCVEFADQHLPAWPARLNGDAVEIAF